MRIIQTNAFKSMKSYKIGDYTYGCPTIKGRSGHFGTVEIGKFCSISENVEIWVGGNHHSEFFTTYPLHCIFNDNSEKYWQACTKGDVKIGNDVWLGYGCKVLSGVEIADGSIIGAYSVVTHNTYPYTVYCGNPAVFKKYRFDGTIIKKLMELKWWNWDIEKIEKNWKVIQSNDVEELLKIS